MSEPNGTPPETSMEVILASIRRIIAEDGIQPPPGNRPPAMRPAPVSTSSPQPQPTATEPAPARPARPQPITVQAEPPIQPVIVQPVIIEPVGVAANPVSPPAEPPASPAAVWGIVGDKPAGTGEELVLTQMVSADGSVVAFDRAPPGARSTIGTVKAAETPASSQPLDVLLLTDALPAKMPDADLAVVPPRAPAAAAPIPAAAPQPVSSPPPSPPIQPAPAIVAAPPLAPRAASTPQREPAPQREPDRVRIGLSPSESLIQSNPVLEELARGRSQSVSQPASQSGSQGPSQPSGQSSGQAGGQPPVAPVAPPVVPLGAPTVEELVRQSLEPKIQEWLNANLKEMVERLVQQEIDKISRRT